MKIQQRVSFILGFSSIHVIYEFCFTYTVGKKPNIGPITEKKAFKRERTVESPYQIHFPYHIIFHLLWKLALLHRTLQLFPNTSHVWLAACYATNSTLREKSTSRWLLKFWISMAGWNPSLGPPRWVQKIPPICNLRRYHFSVITKQQIKPI